MEAKLHNFKGLKITVKTINLEDLIEMQLALYSAKNTEKYYQAGASDTYVEDILSHNKQVSKMQKMIEHQASHFCEQYDARISDILELCLKKENTLEDIYLNPDHDPIIRVLFKKISLVIKAKIQPGSLLDTSKDSQTIIEAMETGKIIYALALLYHLHHQDQTDDEIQGNQREILIYMIMLKIIQFEYEKLQETHTSIKEQLDKNNTEMTKLKEQGLTNKQKIKDLTQEATDIKKRNREEKKQIKQKWDQSHKAKITAQTEAYKSLSQTFDDYKKSTISLEAYNQLKQLIAEKDEQIEQLQLQANEEKIMPKAMLTDDELLKSLEKYCRKQGMTDELLQIVYPYYQEYLTGTQPQKKTERDIAAEQIMYCVIEEGVHYCVDSEGEKHRLLNIPNKTYLAQNQFVLVNQDSNFIRSFNYQYEEKNLKAPIIEFLSAEETTSAINIYHYHLNKGQIVALDDQKQIMTFYRRLDFVIDYFIDSIRAKKHKVYLAIKHLSNGLIVRNYPHMEESYLNLISSEPITCPALLILNDNQDIIKQWEDLSFFTLSMHYPTAEGFIESENDSLYIKKKNGERYLLRKAPEHISLLPGDYVMVDEFNYFMDLLSENMDTELTDERKRLAAKKDKPVIVKPAEAPIEMKDENLLIVGNIKLAETYKLKFFKDGYRVQVVDGFEAYHKIQKEACKADQIIIATDCLSHTNYNRIKQDFADKIIHANNSGPNRILALFTAEAPIYEQVN
ncbi:MAG: hypothetical protein JXQ26_03010 [Tissierellales bacterium]|nr:hypothetical protein [Tissierellales bacterium]MBN2826929.1 hypothetical protein [Tissierellales bacterium]